VGDHGIGIPPDETGHIFERFYRVGHASARTRRGAGLGLFLCRRLVEAHAGRIWVTSTPGSGSVFHFTLPGLAADREILDPVPVSTPRMDKVA
jgi:signal transduction histidine kinase